MKKEGLLIENEIIDGANLGDKITMNTYDKLITIRKTDLTTMEIIKLFDQLGKVREDYLNLLKENCGECDCCGLCDDMDLEKLTLPPYLLKFAGIAENAKLTATVDEDSGVIHIEEAEHEFDLSDVPTPMKDLFESFGICLGELDAMLVRGDIIEE